MKTGFTSNCNEGDALLISENVPHKILQYLRGNSRLELELRAETVTII